MVESCEIRVIAGVVKMASNQIPPSAPSPVVGIFTDPGFTPGSTPGFGPRSGSNSIAVDRNKNTRTS
jgi:hypothetical protein